MWEGKGNEIWKGGMKTCNGHGEGWVDATICHAYRTEKRDFSNGRRNTNSTAALMLAPALTHDPYISLATFSLLYRDWRIHISVNNDMLTMRSKQNVYNSSLLDQIDCCFQVHFPIFLIFLVFSRTFGLLTSVSFSVLWQSIAIIIILLDFVLALCQSHWNLRFCVFFCKLSLSDFPCHNFFFILSILVSRSRPIHLCQLTTVWIFLLSC